MDVVLSRRPAPPPPSTKPSRGQANGKNQTTASGKESIVVVQRKPNKKMPLLKKLTRDTKSRSATFSDSQPGSNNGSVNRDFAGTRTAETNRKSSSQQLQSRPVIIRPESKNVKRKAPPPRPPPPKLGNKPMHLPTYDEVLLADIQAFMGEMREMHSRKTSTTQDTNVPTRLLPPPVKGSSRSTTTSPPSGHVSSGPNKTPLLIDFDEPLIQSPSTSVVVRPRATNRNREELDIFGQDPFSPPIHHTRSAMCHSERDDLGNRFNLGPRVLPPGPVATLSNKSPTKVPHSSSVDVLDSWNNDAVPRRGSFPQVMSRGDDWLHSCLKQSFNGHLQNADFSKLSSSPPPPLPPRPSVSDGAVLLDFGGDFNGDFPRTPSPRLYSPEPPAASPPPVPPFPSNGFTVDEALPPLPPRPKSYDALRPHAVALYNYNSMESDDLSFQAGEIITLVHEVSDEWLYGLIDDREGLFPKNFVDVVIPFDATNEKNLWKKDGLSGPRCRAIYDFVAESKDELTFSVGNVISLIERVGNDWFRGRLHLQEGLFPVTFVEVIEDLPLSGTASESHSKNSVFIALYNFMGEPGELTFKEGDCIKLTGIINDDWLLGTLIGSEGEGRFPKNFVVPL